MKKIKLWHKIAVAGGLGALVLAAAGGWVLERSLERTALERLSAQPFADLEVASIDYDPIKDRYIADEVAVTPGGSDRPWIRGRTLEVSDFRYDSPQRWEASLLIRGAHLSRERMAALGGHPSQMDLLEKLGFFSQAGWLNLKLQYDAARGTAVGFIGYGHEREPRTAGVKFALSDIGERGLAAPAGLALATPDARVLRSEAVYYGEGDYRAEVESLGEELSIDPVGVLQLLLLPGVDPLRAEGPGVAIEAGLRPDEHQGISIGPLGTHVRVLEPRWDLGGTRIGADALRLSHLAFERSGERLAPRAGRVWIEGGWIEGEPGGAIAAVGLESLNGALRWHEEAGRSRLRFDGEQIRDESVGALAFQLSLSGEGAEQGIDAAIARFRNFGGIDALVDHYRARQRARLGPPRDLPMALERLLERPRRLEFQFRPNEPLLVDDLLGEPGATLRGMMEEPAGLSVRTDY